MVTEDIRRLVARAAQDGGTNLSGEKCGVIQRAHDGSGLNEAEIANKLMMVASSAGVAVEFGKSPAMAPARPSGSPSLGLKAVGSFTASLTA